MSYWEKNLFIPGTNWVQTQTLGDSISKNLLRLNPRENLNIIRFDSKRSAPLYVFNFKRCIGTLYLAMTSIWFYFKCLYLFVIVSRPVHCAVNIVHLRLAFTQLRQRACLEHVAPAFSGSVLTLEVAVRETLWQRSNK